MIIANVHFQSDIKILELGEVLSNLLFAGLKFEGLNDNIYEEVPAIYIKKPILGTKVIISGFHGFDNGEWYSLTIEPYVIPNDYESAKKNDITNYLELILAKEFKIIS